jgi:hypothetical protein
MNAPTLFRTGRVSRSRLHRADSGAGDLSAPRCVEDEALLALTRCRRRAQRAARAAVTARLAARRRSASSIFVFGGVLLDQRVRRYCYRRPRAAFRPPLASAHLPAGRHFKCRHHNREPRHSGRCAAARPWPGKYEAMPCPGPLGPGHGLAAQDACSLSSSPSSPGSGRVDRPSMTESHSDPVEPATARYASGPLRSAAARTAPSATVPLAPRARQVTAWPRLTA